MPNRSYRKMTVAQGARHVLNKLSIMHRSYCSLPKLNKTLGFGAMDDMTDKNMLLPFANSFNGSDKLCEFLDKVQAEVNNLLWKEWQEKTHRRYASFEHWTGTDRVSQCACMWEHICSDMFESFQITDAETAKIVDVHFKMLEALKLGEGHTINTPDKTITFVLIKL